MSAFIHLAVVASSTALIVMTKAAEVKTSTGTMSFPFGCLCRNVTARPKRRNLRQPLISSLVRLNQQPPSLPYYRAMRSILQREEFVVVLVVGTPYFWPNSPDGRRLSRMRL
ncbi:unnamed protein product [Dibothriocephalus latus]|uniref:Secreted protein n=1 Tax=Dibothriocephalus latus TaxID=60516 RepID=A0A3P6PUQ8_DIBLA|nr:unnamed protein product [Dibothriocephalus latus]